MAAAEPEQFSVPTLPRPAPGAEMVHLTLNPVLIGGWVGGCFLFL